MKARHIKSLRAKAKYYKVIRTQGLFGSFWLSKFDEDAKIILATSPLEAVQRAKKRGYGLTLSYKKYGTTENWARWMVKEAHKNNHWRNLHYF